MKRKLIVAVVAIPAMAVVTFVIPWLRYHLRIDGCLDAGGRWNYAEGCCETETGG